jgi:hypothetical protein
MTLSMSLTNVQHSCSPVFFTQVIELRTDIANVSSERAGFARTACTGKAEIQKQTG